MSTTTSKEIVTRVEFHVASSMVIADPCYIDQDDSDGSCLAVGGHVLKQAAGVWVAEIDLWDSNKTGGWGERVGSITATRKDASLGYKNPPREVATPRLLEV